MREKPTRQARTITALAAFTALAACVTLHVARGGQKPSEATSSTDWVQLIGSSGSLDEWLPAAGWQNVGRAWLNAGDLKKLAASTGKGVVYNGPTGRAFNLLTRSDFGDVDFHCEFLVPKGSNSGVKFQAVYEIQIYDSYGVKKVTASHSGGIYPRAEFLPKYHHIDDGYPPKINASRPPGEWQSLDVVFRAPRFDKDGKKTAGARFEKVVLNGLTVQENVEVPYPTGNNWRNKEHPTGPILLQGDHGSVAFRKVRVRPLPSR